MAEEKQVKKGDIPKWIATLARNDAEKGIRASAPDKKKGGR